MERENEIERDRERERARFTVSLLMKEGCVNGAETLRRVLNVIPDYNLGANTSRPLGFSRPLYT